MNTEILKYIIAIAQEKSITRAADRFYLTQPVLSRHLKKIENRVGAPLFQRQKEGMILTEAGRIYINSAQNMLHLEAELERDLEDILRQEKTSLHVYAEPPYARLLSGLVLPKFHEKYPDVQARITLRTAEEIQASLADGEKGIGVLTMNGQRDTALEYVQLHEDEIVLLRPDNARGKDTVFLRPAGTTVRALEDQWLQRAGVNFSTVLEVATFRAGVEGVQFGLGCASALKSMAGFVGLVPCPEVPPMPFLCCAAYPKNMVFHPAQRMLMQTIINEFGDWHYTRKAD